MNLIPKRKTPLPATDTEAKLAALDAVIAERRARDDVLIAETVRLERQGARRSTDSPSAVTERAAARLAGVVPLRVPASSIRRLDAVDAERAEIAAFMPMAQKERAHLLDERRVELVREWLAPWRAVQRERAVCAVRLQRLSRDAEAIKRKFVKCGVPNFPVDGHALLGAGIVGDAVYRFVQDMLRDQTITPGEVAQFAKDEVR